MKTHFPFRLVIQLPLTKNWENGSFEPTLKLLSKYHFWGIELHVVDPEQTDVYKLKKLLDIYEIKLAKLATGQIASLNHLSLASNDDSIHESTILNLKKQISFASFFGCPLILGAAKGLPLPDKKAAELRTIQSLKQILPYAEALKTPLVIEATNHYESCTANTLQSTAELISKVKKTPFLYLLPDTYHMNIEEVCLESALVKYIDYYDSIHFSDSNRFYPGYGHIDFQRICSLLSVLHFQGYIGIEGNTHTSLEQDLEITTSILSHITT